MGFLSTLLTIGGTIAGSFVGAPQIGAAIGGAVGGAIDQSGASNKASKAQQAAQQAAIAEREKGYQRVLDIQQPFLSTGATGVNALTGRLGLSAGPARAGPPAAAPGNALAGGAPSYSTSPLEDPFKAGLGGLNYTPLPVAPTATQPKPVQPGQPQPQPTSTTPMAGPGVIDPGTYGDTANPVDPGAYQAPAPFKYDLTDYKASPGYQYQQDEAARATLAHAGATGALQSGAALKELQDRAQKIAYGDFTNERAFAAGQSNLDRQFGLNAYTTNDTRYNNNRNYLTDRADTQTGNLFRYTGIGQQAAGAVSGAATGVANGNAGSQVDIGNARAGNALAQGQIGSNFATGLGGILGSGFGGNGGNALKPVGVVQNPDLTTRAVNGNAALINPLPTYKYGY